MHRRAASVCDITAAPDIFFFRVTMRVICVRIIYKCYIGTRSMMANQWEYNMRRARRCEHITVHSCCLFTLFYTYYYACTIKYTSYIYIYMYTIEHMQMRKRKERLSRKHKGKICTFYCELVCIICARVCVCLYCCSAMGYYIFFTRSYSF